MHRDIAARNVLLAHPSLSDPFQCMPLQTAKIADFGWDYAHNYKKAIFI